jgi:hypothetical protein
MGLDAKIVVTQIAYAVRKDGALLARHIRRLVEASRRRAMYEEEFDRNYETYCRANGLRPVWAEDRKAGGWRQQ